MPTSSRSRRLLRGDAETLIRICCFPDGARAGAGVGLELEFFAMHHRGQPHPSPGARMPLSADGTTPGLVDLLGASGGEQAGRHRGPGGGEDDAALTSRLTFEPGGQVELSRQYHQTPGAAIDDADLAARTLARICAEHDVVLLACGADPWHADADLPLQLQTPRYLAMDAYLARRGTHGVGMMRHTCALQINLDAGRHATAAARWDVANLVAPLAVASFANSPDAARGLRSLRSWWWQHLDPTRTGVPVRFVAGDPDPAGQMLDAAMAADVLLVRTGEDDAVPGEPGWSFGTWLEHGHDTFGWPTADDLRYHLTTLFHEVRPRGALEIRSIDALPARWRAVPVVLYAGLLYDDEARGRVRTMLDRHRWRIPGLLRRAAAEGVADGELCALAVEVWSLALAGARRLPPGSLSPRHLQRVESFIDHFTTRGRCPADDFGLRLADDTHDALRWASEPLEASTEIPT